MFITEGGIQIADISEAVIVPIHPEDYDLVEAKVGRDWAETH